jgi:hypothetical protein
MSYSSAAGGRAWFSFDAAIGAVPSDAPVETDGLTVELMMLDDRLRISVFDRGSRLDPRILRPDHERVGETGLSLRTIHVD